MAAKKGFGAKLSYDSGGGTYVPVAGVTRIRPAALKADVIDGSDHDSPNEYREKFAGMLDSGEAVFDLNYNEKDTTHIYLVANLGVTKSYRVTFGGSTPKTATFSGFLSNIGPEIPHDNKQTAAVTITISGVITWA